VVVSKSFGENKLCELLASAIKSCTEEELSRIMIPGDIAARMLTKKIK